MEEREPLFRPQGIEPLPPLPNLEPAAEEAPGWRLFGRTEGSNQPVEASRPAGLGESILALLGIRRRQTEQSPTITEVTAPIPTPEAVEIERPATIVERAKDMGRNVLRLLRGVRQEVAAADSREQMSESTDTEPLTHADSEVRAAMQELIDRPTESARERQPNHDIAPMDPDILAAPLPADYIAPAEPFQPAPLPESAPDVGGTQRPISSPSRMLEIAEQAVKAVAHVTAERLERPRASGIIRKIGVAALSGALVYTWYRQHTLKRQQKRQRRDFKRFETDVRREQQRASERIHKLEEIHVRELPQQKRQDYVREVSRFALGQAQEIRTIATRVRQPDVAPHIPAISPEHHPVVLPLPPTEHSPQFAQSPRVELQSVPELKPSIAPVYPPKAPTTPERPPLLPLQPERITPERPSVMRRIANVLSGPPDRVAAPASVGMFDRLMGFTPTPPSISSQTKKGQPQTVPSPQTSQAWLLGIVLALGIGIVLMLVMDVL